MKIRIPLIRVSVTLFLTWLGYFGIPLSGQTEIQVLYKGEYHPLYFWKDGGLWVHVDGKRRKADSIENKVEKAESFGEGFVDVVVLRKETLDKSQESKRVADDILFRYEIELTADRDLNYCYGALVYIVNGTPENYFLSIGNLRKGKSKKLKIETAEIVSKVGNFHVFSEGKEIRSTGVADGQTMVSEAEAYLEGIKGVPIVDLIETEKRYPHLLSADGSRFITFRDKDTHIVLAVFDTSTHNLEHQLEIGEYSNDVTDLHLLSEEEVLFVLRDSKSKSLLGAEVDDYSRSLYYYKIGNEAAEKILDDVSSISHQVFESQDEVVLRDYRDGKPFRFNVRTRERDTKDTLESQRSGHIDWYGKYRLSWKRKGKYVHYYYKLPGVDKWQSLDDLNNEPGLIFAYDPGESLDRRVDIETITPDPNKLYIWLANEEGMKELALYDVPSGKVERVLFATKTYDLGGSGVDDARILYDKKEREIIGLIANMSVHRTFWLRESFKTNQAIIDSALPNTANIPVDWSEDGETMIYYSHNEKTRGKYYLFKPKLNQLTMFYDLSPKLNKHELGTMRPFSFKARDGYTIHGYITFPPEYAKGDRMPLIVYPHGGPTVRDSFEFNTTVQYLAALGYGVLQVNYRGSAGYGMHHKKSGLEGEIGESVIDDIADATQFLIKGGYADEDRIVILGGSFGGYCAYMSMIRYPDLYQAGIAVAAISRWNLFVSSSSYYGNEIGHAFWKEIISRSNDPDYEKKISPVFRADEITKPILIIHGEYDYNVTPEHARIMERELRKLGKDVELVLFPYSGHGFFGDNTRPRYLEELKRFIEKHI